MGFFSRIKELANLKKEIENQNVVLEQKRNVISGLEINIIEIQNKIKNLERDLSNREQTMENIRGVLRAENEREKKIILEQAKKEAEAFELEAKNNLAALLESLKKYTIENEDLTEENEKLRKEVNRRLNQARKFKAQVLGLKNFDERFPHTINFDSVNTTIEQLSLELDEDTILGTILSLPLHSDNSRELRKLSNATKKEIKRLLEEYESRYNTKANRTIYHLMIIGLQAEMEILLYKLTYEKLDVTKQSVKDIMTKYLVIASEGNQNILPTITKFIAEIEPLYLELVDIEYRYYIYRQREKEEQIAIKERIKQEVEERKALEAERKKLDKEESKYITEMQRNKDLLEIETDETKINQLKNRLQELEQQLAAVEEKKEEVTRLALGKAGYVYVISNLGSFGSNIFKIGMTRRLEPQQRVDELGSASVPFRFDVHAMIFSDDAVALENNLHKNLSDSRVNKVNFRKEFFRTDIDSLEKLVEDVDPTADFARTMYAAEYKQTLAIEENTKAFNI